MYFQSAMVPHFHIGGQIIWAKQYSAVWKQLVFMGTILFFPYPFFKNCENQANVFSKTMQFLKTHGKDSLGGIFLFFFNLSL